MNALHICFFLGFWLDPELHGRGWMTEAANAVTAFAFERQVEPRKRCGMRVALQGHRGTPRRGSHIAMAALASAALCAGAARAQNATWDAIPENGNFNNQFNGPRTRRRAAPLSSTPPPSRACAQVAWAHDWVSNPALNASFESLPGTSFTVFGAPIPHDSALTSAGAELFFTPNWSLQAKIRRGVRIRLTGTPAPARYVILGESAEDRVRPPRWWLGLRL
jgi:hypothetical protein